jgi:hypothetical protein
MNRLLNVNRESGYPLVGENLKILAEDYPNYLTAILDSFEIPALTCVFLQLNQQNGILQNSLVYFSYRGHARLHGIFELRVDNSRISVNDLLSGNIPATVSAAQADYAIENSAGIFPEAYRIRYMTLDVNNPSTNNKYVMLEDIIRAKSQTPSLNLDLSRCNFYTGTTLGFDSQGNITGVSPLDPQWATFVGPDNFIERIGNYLKVNFAFSGSPAGGGGTGVDFPKNIIELPEGFVNFTRITRLKASIDAGNNVNAALANSLEAIIYNRYIIMFSTTGTRHGVVDYVPIV